MLLKKRLTTWPHWQGGHIKHAIIVCENGKSATRYGRKMLTYYRVSEPHHVIHGSQYTLYVFHMKTTCPGAQSYSHNGLFRVLWTIRPTLADEYTYVTQTHALTHTHTRRTHTHTYARRNTHRRPPYAEIHTWDTTRILRRHKLFQDARSDVGIFRHTDSVSPEDVTQVSTDSVSSEDVTQVKRYGFI